MGLMNAVIDMAVVGKWVVVALGQKYDALLRE